jgi:hypothetical protein
MHFSTSRPAGTVHDGISPIRRPAFASASGAIAATMLAFAFTAMPLFAQQDVPMRGGDSGSPARV